MFTVLQGGEVYAPEPLGRSDVLLAGSQMAQIGTVDCTALERTKLPLSVSAAQGCPIIPGAD